MQGLSRRDASRLMAFGLLAPVFLKADGTPEIESPSANYEMLRAGDGSLKVSSKSSELRFRIGKNAFLLRPNSQIKINATNVAIKSMSLISGGVMGVFAPGEKKIEARTFTAGIRGTGIYLEDKGEDAVYCCLCYGVADYVGADSSNLMSLTSIHHDRPVVIEQTKSKQIRMYDDKTHNHDDDELRALEKMCGREVPFEEWLRLQKIQTPSYSY